MLVSSVSARCLFLAQRVLWQPAKQDRKILATTLTAATSAAAMMTATAHRNTTVKCEAQGSGSSSPSPSSVAHEISYDYDIYLHNVTKSDLPYLCRAHQDGLNVWPWVWTQPNVDGPHHVFVGPVSVEQLDQIRNVKECVPNVNILVVTDRESIKRLPKGEQSLYQYECGLVLDTPVEIADLERKILLLQDERIINYTVLYSC